MIGGSTGENVLIGVGQLFGEVDPSVPGRKNNLQEVVQSLSMFGFLVAGLKA